MLIVLTLGWGEKKKNIYPTEVTIMSNKKRGNKAVEDWKQLDEAKGAEHFAI